MCISLIEFFGSLDWQQLYHISGWFYPSSKGSSPVWPAGHFSSSEQKWRNLDWYHCPGFQLTCRCWEWIVSYQTLRAWPLFVWACLSHEPISSPKHLSHFLSLHFPVSVSSHNNVLLPLLILTHNIDSHALHHLQVALHFFLNKFVVANC